MTDIFLQTNLVDNENNSYQLGERTGSHADVRLLQKFTKNFHDE
jgi:hypothetical protein